MMTLLDSSVWISYFHVDDEHHEKAVGVVEKMITEDALIILPEIVLAEVTNVLIRLDRSGSLLDRFRMFLRDFDLVVETAFGSRQFWTRTIEEVSRLVRLKTLDLIIVSYAYHFHVDLFRSFDIQQEKAAQKILKR